MLDKLQVIEAIQDINKSVSSEWLVLFDHKSLRAYLDHLQLTIEPRGGTSIWVRRGDTPAVVSRIAAY